MRKPLLVLSALALGISSVVTPMTATAALPTAVNNQQVPSLAPMLEQVTPAVVSIAVEGKHVSKQRLPEAYRFFFGPDFPTEQVREQPFRGLGSGVIIDAKKGYVVTNNHVVDGAETIKVQLSDGREVKAKLLGTDKMSDIALLQLEDAKDLTAIKLADSDNLRVGDFAVAIGNPFGLGQTVTSGIVSALGRSGLNIENFENFIQTDAPINSGNSGGALVNLNGELIGINTAILGPNGGNVGIGFAIPANMVKNLTDQLIEFGQVKRGVLGVTGGELTSELAETFGYKTNHGAFVSQVLPEGSAAKAGLKAGDIIVSVNNKPIRTFSELRAKIATLGAGKKVTLGLIRDGKELNVPVTLEAAKQTQVKADDLHESLAGAEFANTSPEDKVHGVKVTELNKQSIAARYGLKKGDIIIGLNRQPIKNLGELRKALEKKPNVLAMEVKRGDSVLYLIMR
ncbi:Do family serine endopeptidase [Photobacterium damselae]|nr:Do family serine endopeptidase [Photobacterium damselae]EJN6960708.1 Do family serine endopeptidase [Photobacterium damselae]UKA06615.1 Do family serine endopeptidase [Photobacterium damselae subsp. damselae]UKA21718.1 Do family serine endopeptidase [Photobacterium damselae subsp. damselae]